MSVENSPSNSISDKSISNKNNHNNNNNNNNNNNHNNNHNNDINHINRINQNNEIPHDLSNNWFLSDLYNFNVLPNQERYTPINSNNTPQPAPSIYNQQLHSHSPIQHSPLSQSQHPLNQNLPSNLLQSTQLPPQQLQSQSQSQSLAKTKQKRPCDQCRRRKTKCVLVPNSNNCVSCETKQTICTFTSQALKRKPIEMENDQLKKNKTDFSSHLLPNESIQVPDVPIRDVQPIQDYSSINNSLLKKTLSLQFPRSSFYIGPTSYLYDINLLDLIIDNQNKNITNNNKIEQVSLSDSISLRKVSETTQFVLKDDQSPQSYQTMSNDVDTIEKFVSPHGQILIDLYFRIIHPSYPILHKKVFLEKYSRTHREFSAPLLAAVYVLAIQWWDYDPQLNRFPKPNVELILKIGLNNYLLEILKRPKLSAVQAGLLLLQRKHITNYKNINGSLQKQIQDGDTEYSDWVLCSQVVSLSEELGLGLDCNNWKLPKWERGLRKRLAWAVYMEDKWLSLNNSRPSHINEDNWIVQPLQSEDFPEKHGDGDLKEGSSDIDNGKKIFINLIELSKILSDILKSFYSMKAMNEIIEVDDVLKIAKPLQLRLRNWFHSLPVELQMSSVQPRKLCSNGYLQLAYFATELTLHRKIITIIYQQTKLGNQPSNELINVCRAAAKTRLMASIEFVRDLKPEHIHSFWHSSSSSNFTLIGTFAAILFMSSPTKEETDFYRDQIFNYRWVLKISSKGFDQVAEALVQLDLVLANVPGLLNDNVDLPMVTPNVPDQKSPYSPFYQQVNNNHSPDGISPKEKKTTESPSK
ncbi:unnamed protein product [Candida verbasci]|uniref:Zn(2)-C6 fungal-type domain-containing protein n=1 Tax=Candida verbasci TaxID=1227364 RepID=A0A9W4X814_9ASCO|nr:unnamed protein product [Candida verbasci]